MQTVPFCDNLYEMSKPCVCFLGKKRKKKCLLIFFTQHGKKALRWLDTCERIFCHFAGRDKFSRQEVASLVSETFKTYCSRILLLTLVLLNPDIPFLCKQCRSRSVGFWRSQLIWICTVCHEVCELISTTWMLKIRSGCGLLIYSAGQDLKNLFTYGSVPSCSKHR